MLDPQQLQIEIENLTVEKRALRLENDDLRYNLNKQNSELMAMRKALRAFVEAYDNEMWPIENEIGLFEEARKLIS